MSFTTHDACEEPNTKEEGRSSTITATHTSTHLVILVEQVCEELVCRLTELHCAAWLGTEAAEEEKHDIPSYDTQRLS